MPNRVSVYVPVRHSSRGLRFFLSGLVSVQTQSFGDVRKGCGCAKGCRKSIGDGKSTVPG